MLEWWSQLAAYKSDQLGSSRSHRPARASDLETKSRGGVGFRFDGTTGTTQRAPLELQSRNDALIIVDGLPDAVAGRKLLLERFNSLSGSALLFAPMERR